MNTQMTTVTINKKQYKLEQVIAQAVEKAGNGYVCPPDQQKAAQYPTVENAAWKITVARYIINTIQLYHLDWQKFNYDDLLGSMVELTAKYNRRAGVRGLVKKYGHESAERIVKNHSGRTIR